MQTDVFQILSLIVFPVLKPSIPAAIAGLGGGEIILIIITLLMLLVRIGVPIAVIFLLYQWWKNRDKNKSE